MAVVEIPVPVGRFDAEIQIALDGVTYGMRFRYNTRMDAWFLDLSDEEGVPILSGRRIVVDWPLLERRSRAVPPGHLYAFDTTLRQQDPGRDDLGTRVLLLYIDESEGI